MAGHSIPCCLCGGKSTVKFPLLLAALAAASIDAGANRATRRAEKACSLRESVDLKTASRITGIAYSTLRQWISQGDLPAYRVNGTRVRVYIDDLQNLFVPVHEHRNAR
jgi:excisionase family DNA binding protein